MKPAVKLLTFITALLCISFSGHGQVFKKLGDRVKQKVNERIGQKTDRTIDKGLDKAEKVGKETGKSKDVAVNTDSNNNDNDNNSTASSKTTNNTGKQAATAAGPAFQVYSKFDFVPGDKVIAYDDFSRDAIGDFPVTWNTNSSGEVVTSSAHAGRWLMIKKQGKFILEYIKTLPENFTFEYDLICNDQFSFFSPPLSLFFLSGNNGNEVFDQSFISLQKRSGVKFSVLPTNSSSTTGIAYVENFEDGVGAINNQVSTTQFNSFAGKTKLHVSIWRQKQRIRVYLNEEKVFDLPRAFADGKMYSTVLLETWREMNSDKDGYLIGNIKLSAGTPDTRNKLITEGRFVTRGILFDINSDKIRPESYAVLKEIATVLTENASVNVKIVGHTDTDGSDADNLALSKRRAESVKNSLASDFGIASSRLETDGKGESQPLEKNSSAEGKANNRRVEFIKF